MKTYMLLKKQVSQKNMVLVSDSITGFERSKSMGGKISGFFENIIKKSDE